MKVKKTKEKRAKQNDKIQKEHSLLFSLSRNLIERLDKTLKRQRENTKNRKNYKETTKTKLN